MAGCFAKYIATGIDTSALTNRKSSQQKRYENAIQLLYPIRCGICIRQSLLFYCVLNGKLMIKLLLIKHVFPARVPKMANKQSLSLTFDILGLLIILLYVLMGNNLYKILGYMHRLFSSDPH